MASRKQLLQVVTKGAGWSEFLQLAKELQDKWKSKPAVGVDTFETVKNAVERDAKVSAVQTLIDEAERIAHE